MPLTLQLQHAGPLATAVDAARLALRQGRVAARLLARDHTLWKPEPTEIANRLGWLDSPARVAGELAGIDAVVDAVRADGYTHALLLGMGGSSLAPEVFRRLFGVGAGHLDLAVLDSTDPAAVAAATGRLDPARTLYLPATKSGGTVETLSFTKHCYGQLVQAVGRQAAGRHLVAITDPGSGLADLAAALGARHIFLNDPDIGGRYSALSLFGIVPARLGGVDAVRLLAGGRTALDDVRDDGAGLRLGAILGAAASAGRDKLTLLAGPGLAPLGVWIEQLVAESTGKEGRGILPVDGEPLGPPAVYGDDRLFVHLHLAGESAGDVAALAAAGQPVVDLRLDDVHDVGEAMLVWEVATAVAGHLLAINPFDQPDVEAAKMLARSLLDAYRQRGALPAFTPDRVEADVAVFGAPGCTSLSAALAAFLRATTTGGYVALQAYLPPTAGTDAALTRLRQAVRDNLRVATTAGYGPRFLHSTGQLHKGDAGRGRFLQITCDDTRDVPIPDAAGSPDSTVTFGVLKAAQALGDRQALLDGGRAVLRLHLGADVEAGLRHLADAVDAALS